MPEKHIARIERVGWYALRHGTATLTLFQDRLEIELPDLTIRNLRLIDIAEIGWQEKPGLLSHFTVSATPRSAVPVRVSHLPVEPGRNFFKLFDSARNNAFRHLFEARRQDIQSLLNDAAHTDPPDGLLLQAGLQQFQQKIRQTLGPLASGYPEGALSPTDARDLGHLLRILRHGEQWLQQSNRAFMERFRPACEKQLGRPLTDEQWAAASVLSPATLVLAPAGSGKTNVIVARVATLLAAKLASPGEVLVLAYNKDAANEVSGRIREQLGVDIHVRTFHRLGYEIIGQSDGRKPPVAPLATDDAALSQLIRCSLEELLAGNSTLGAVALNWLAQLDRPYRSRFSFSTQAQYFEYLRSVELRSLNGDLVRSFEECEIANFLFMNGVSYVYESEYRWPTASRERRDYTPDFWLPDYDIYIEHFGVRRTRGPDGSEILTTAPGIDRERYLADMDWKRDLHRRHNTRLIETFSWQKQEHILTSELARKLGEAGVAMALIPKDRVLERVNALGRIEPLCELLGAFLKHFKDRGLTPEALKDRVRERGDDVRDKSFVEIFEHVRAAHARELGSRIDFEDMIEMASAAVRAARYASPHRFILVDEFQDISEGRARLLDALAEQAPGAELFCVGDDWQSIYRFAGSDVGIMQRFAERFGQRHNSKASQVSLSLTFRCSPTITQVAAEFVQKNPRQIPKPVRSIATPAGAPIRIVRCRRTARDAALKAIVETIATEAAAAGSRREILVLGRYNRSKPQTLAALGKMHPGIRISFRSIHSAKGLEADHVVVADMDAAEGRLGFPARSPDEPILRLVQPEAEDFPFAEERRLFYVALTRARHSVTLLADPDHPSAFVREIEINPEYRELVSGVAMDNLPPCIECGGAMVAKRHATGVRFVCVQAPFCANASPSCPSCGDGMPSKPPGTTAPGRWSCSSCSAPYEACPKCQAGWLVPRTGKYGPFLSCSRRVTAAKGCQYSRSIRNA